jgi:hypothetical protein
MKQLGSFFYKYGYSFTTHAKRRSQGHTAWILRCEKEKYVFIGMGNGLENAVLSLCHDILRNRDVFPELKIPTNMIRVILQEHFGCIMPDDYPEVDDGLSFDRLIEAINGEKRAEGSRAATWKDVRCLVPDNCRTRAKYKHGKKENN